MFPGRILQWLAFILSKGGKEEDGGVWGGGCKNSSCDSNDNA